MKKNAFTLIELLAVIVILGILATITVPTIVGIINNIIVFKMLLIFIALIVPIYSNMVIKVERNSFK